MKDERTFVIAEMACSHDGDVDLAKQIIEGAIDAGSDAIQFQIWNLDDALTPDHPDFEFCRGIELSKDQWRELVEFCRKKSSCVEVIACVEEPGSVDFAEEVGVDAYKLHTSELANPEMIDKVSKTGKRIDLSIGASSLDEIQKALTRIRSLSNAEIWLMYGYQNFPTDPKDVNLSYLQTLEKVFGLRVGYQDHTNGNEQGAFWLPASAHGMGILIQEKHITHDRAKKGCDHQAALNPDEFKSFVEMLKLLDAAKGNCYARSFTEGEQKYRRYAKKSMVASRAIAKGDLISADDIRPMRAPELGIPPDECDSLIGKIALKDFKQFEIIVTEEIGR